MLQFHWLFPAVEELLSSVTGLKTSLIQGTKIILFFLFLCSFRELLHSYLMVVAKPVSMPVYQNQQYRESIFFFNQPIFQPQRLICFI